MAANKNSRDEIIEYNPDELSYDGSQDEDNYYPNQSMLPAHNMCQDQHQYQSDKNLEVVGKAMPVYGCKNCGKNPYYVVISRPRHMTRPKMHNFDSIDNQYNCLGIDEKEAYKIVSAQPLNDNKVDCGILNSIDEWNHNKNNSFIDIYDNEMQKPGDDMSEEIIAVNDSDNEMIVPHDMQIHDIEQNTRVQPMMLPDSIDYMPKNKLSLSKNQLMSSS
jgi:hypothetical protein